MIAPSPMPTRRRLHFAGVAAIALALVGCGRSDTTVRPFVKRGGDAASEKSPAEKTTDAVKSDAVKTAEPGKTPAGKTAEKT